MPFIPESGEEEHKVELEPDVPDPAPVVAPMGDEDPEIDGDGGDSGEDGDDEHPHIAVPWYRVVNNDLTPVVPVSITYCTVCDDDRGKQVDKLFRQITILMGQIILYRIDPTLFNFLPQDHRIWFEEMSVGEIPSPDNFLFGIKLPGDDIIRIYRNIRIEGENNIIEEGVRDIPEEVASGPILATS